MATTGLPFVPNGVNIDLSSEIDSIDTSIGPPSDEPITTPLTTNQIWIVDGSEHDVELVRHVGLDAIKAPEVLGFTRHPDITITEALTEAVRDRVVVYLPKYNTTHRFRSHLGASIVLRQIAKVATAVKAAIPLYGDTKLDDLYTECGSDARCFRRALRKRLRPVQTNQLIDYLTKRWSRWSQSRQERELDHAVRHLSYFESDAATWATTLAASLTINVSTIEAQQVAALTSAAGEEATEFATQKWMTAALHVIGPRGIFRQGKTKATRVTVAPINISEVGVDEHGRRYCVLRFRYGSNERAIVVSRSVVAGHELLSTAALGTPVTSDNLRPLVRFLAQQEADNLDRIPSVPIFTQCGWSADYQSYVLGESVIGAGGRTVVQAEPRFLAGLRARGDAVTYRAIVIAARDASVDAEAAWAVGYASPLLRLLGLRGLVFSIWGDSGYGKTASQALAVSPWGRPESLKLTGDATPTALEAYLSMSRDLIAHFDDTQLTRQQDLLDVLTYLGASGVGRGRGTQTGGLRAVATWLCVLCVSGEKPLLRAGAAAGYANRLLEIQAKPFTKEFAKNLHQQLDEHHGHTGPAFIIALISRYITTAGRAELRELFDREIVHLDRTRSERAKQVALLVIASFLARMLVFGEDEVMALAAARRMGAAILERASKQAAVTPDVVGAAHDEIIAWVAEHIESFQEPDPEKTVRRMGIFVSNVGPHRVVAILPGPFRELAARCNFDREQVLHGLAARGLLITEDGRLSKKTMALGDDRPRAHWVVLGQDDKNGAKP